MTFEAYSYERRVMVRFKPDLDFETFVAKIQKAKTRKDKGYFVLRATMPKEIAEKLKVQPGDRIVFKAKKAEWYHLCNWQEMESTWEMLPQDIKMKALADGIKCPGTSTTPFQSNNVASTAPLALQ